MYRRSYEYIIHILDIAKKSLKKYINPKSLRFAAFWLVMLTWGLPQTACGLILMLTRYRHCPRAIYHGAIVVAHDGAFGGVSLGAVTFVSRRLKPRTFAAIRAHEYGHCVQSLILGPLYLPVIALPSGLWCNLPYCERRRSMKRISYYSFFTERWANILTLAVTHDKPPER